MNKLFAAVADLRRQHVFLISTFKSGFCCATGLAPYSLWRNITTYTLWDKRIHLLIIESMLIFPDITFSISP